MRTMRAWGAGDDRRIIIIKREGRYTDSFTVCVCKKHQIFTCSSHAVTHSEIHLSLNEGGFATGASGRGGCGGGGGGGGGGESRRVGNMLFPPPSRYGTLLLRRGREGEEKKGKEKERHK